MKIELIEVIKILSIERDRLNQKNEDYILFDKIRNKARADECADLIELLVNYFGDTDDL